MKVKIDIGPIKPLIADFMYEVSALNILEELYNLELGNVLAKTLDRDLQRYIKRHKGYNQ